MCYRFVASPGVSRCKISAPLDLRHHLSRYANNTTPYCVPHSRPINASKYPIQGPLRGRTFLMCGQRKALDRCEFRELVREDDGDWNEPYDSMFCTQENVGEEGDGQGGDRSAGGGYRNGDAEKRYLPSCRRRTVARIRFRRPSPPLNRITAQLSTRQI